MLSSPKPTNDTLARESDELPSRLIPLGILHVTPCAPAKLELARSNSALKTLDIRASKNWLGGSCRKPYPAEQQMIVSTGVTFRLTSGERSGQRQPRPRLS